MWFWSLYRAVFRQIEAQDHECRLLSKTLTILNYSKKSPENKTKDKLVLWTIYIYGLLVSEENVYDALSTCNIKE